MAFLGLRNGRDLPFGLFQGFYIYFSPCLSYLLNLSLQCHFLLFLAIPSIQLHPFPSIVASIMNSPVITFSLCKVWTYCLTITISSFYYGYNAGAFNSSMETIAEALHWDSKKSLYTTMFTAAYHLGGMMSCMFAAKCTNKFGRRKTLMVASLVGIAVHCFNVIPNTWTFGISRLLAGAISGFLTVIPPLFVNEISPTSISGRTGALVGISIYFGVVIPSLFALALPTEDYST